MKILKVGVAILATVLMSGAVGCSQSGDQKDAEKMEQEGTALISSWKTNVTDLSYKKINLLDGISAPGHDWSQYSDSDLKEIARKLKSVSRSSSRIVEIANHKNMVFAGNKAVVSQVGENSRAYLESLKAYIRTH